MLFILQGCEFSAPPEKSPPVTSTTPEAVFPTPEIPVLPPARPGQFTIRYVTDSPVNPITCMNRDNTVLSSLLYEGLFTLDSNLNVRPVLCASWTTDDFITYTFQIKEDIAMSDGSRLKGSDVVYTLKQAAKKGRFVNRLGIIKNVSSQEELTVTVTLNSPNNKLIWLLDVPIIKEGSIAESVPAGTGPYVFPASGSMRLIPFTSHRNYSRLPLTEIFLIECHDNELAELFDDGRISLLWDDPSDTFNIILNRQKEARFYDSTALQFIGFNARTICLADSYVRRAIGSSLNRRYIVDTIMPGQSYPAQLALSSAYRLYDTHWEQMVVDPLKEMTYLFKYAGLEDFDNDSFLEFPDGAGGYFEIALDFIVNVENPYKVRTAHRISDTLRLYGIEIIVRELTWDNFVNALETGAFDLYYGEIVLGADYDFSSLLLPTSRLNYGRTASTTYKQYVEAFLSAENDTDEKQAAEALCVVIREEAPFVPILYKRYTVYTPIGAITGAAPSQSGVFNNIANWSIDLNMIP